jgi:sugar lactone lactonase YvrE
MTGGEAPGPYGHHDGGEFSPVKVRAVATWPASTFVENLAIDSRGAAFVTLHSHNGTDRYDPATGRIAPFADLPAPPMDLAFGTDGLLWVTGGPFPKDPGYIWRITPDGTVEHWVDLPDAIWMNGCTFHPDGRTLLACESETGRILAIGTLVPGRWSDWLVDDRLKPEEPNFPGANGIKFRDGSAWISVSGRWLMLRTTLEPDGRPGLVEPALTSLLGDDFAFGASGSLYVATHVAQTVVRIDAAENRAMVVGPKEGAVGATACAFGHAPDDKRALYVTTNGGFIVPFEGRIQDAKLLRIDVGEGAWAQE